MKRIIVCCDGTSQNGTVLIDPRVYTNVLRLSRVISKYDKSQNPPIPQIVFYQQGIGSENNFYTEYLKEWLHAGEHTNLENATDTIRKLWKEMVSDVEGMTGAPLADKVQEAYAFIASNYEPGDKIYLFGFSRGAYTARMVAAFIGEIGIFTKEGMDSFGKTFVEHQIIGHTSAEDAAKRVQNLKNAVTQEGMLFENIKDKDGYCIECVGVFDTVGSVGLPVEIVGSYIQKNIFGFSDATLGSYIRTAYHALAIDEPRKDFLPVLWEQTEEGQKKGQKLVQCWFRGVHSDIGGGYRNHDIADITLAWMIANIQDKIDLDIPYLEKIPEPAYKWGTMKPHDAMKGPYRIADRVKDRLGVVDARPPPRAALHSDKLTNEVFHASVKEQDAPDYLKKILLDHPHIFPDLLPLEVQMRTYINSLPLGTPVDEEPDFVDTVGHSVQQVISKTEESFTDPNSFWMKFVHSVSPK